MRWVLCCLWRKGSWLTTIWSALRLNYTLVPGIWPNLRWSPADQVSVLRAIAMHTQRCNKPGSNNWSGFRTRCLRVAGAGGGARAWLRRAFAFIKSPGWRVQTIVNVSQDRAFCPMGFFLTCSFISFRRSFFSSFKNCQWWWSGVSLLLSFHTKVPWITWNDNPISSVLPFAVIIWYFLFVIVGWFYGFFSGGGSVLGIILKVNLSVDHWLIKSHSEQCPSNDLQKRY